MRTILGVLAFVPLLTLPPLSFASPSEGEVTTYTFAVRACQRHLFEDGRLGGCTAIFSSRLQSHRGDVTGTSSFREVSYRPIDVTKDQSAAVRASLQRSSPEDGQQEGGAEGFETGHKSAREGFTLTLKPLYESDESLYLQYKVETQSIRGWEKQVIEAGVATQMPATRRAMAVGTERLLAGQSFRLEKGAYTFDITFARKVD